MGYVKIIAVGLVWILSVITSLKGWYKIVVALLSIVIKPLRLYAFRIWLSDDQDIFTLVGGNNPDHSISGHIGYEAKKGKTEYLQAEKVVNTLFWFDNDHCRDSIEWDRIKAKFLNLK